MARRGMGGQVNNMARQMKRLQGKIAAVQEELKEREWQGSAGGGVVTATVNYEGEIVGVKLDPETLKNEEATAIETMLVAALKDAQTKAKDESEEAMNKATGGNLKGLGLGL